MTDTASSRSVTPGPDASNGGMLNLLNGFVVELRNAGLPVSLTENLDAMEAVQHIPDRGPRCVQIRVRCHADQKPCALAQLRDGF